MPEANKPALEKWHGKVAVVTVTYGKRWHFLQQVLGRLLQDPLVGPIVVIDNAAEDPIAANVQTQGWQPRVSVVEMGENAGSAKGYCVGIDKALAMPQIEFVYLLDDDNLPAPATISTLLTTYHAKGEQTVNAMLSLRPDRVEFVRAAHGMMDIRIQPNSFLGFHLMAIPEKIWRHIKLRISPLAKKQNYLHPVCKVGYAPYGGLLMHRDLVGLIGLPDERFYLYADDHEYTSRIAELDNAAIWLCVDSVVEDIEKSWNLGKTKVHPLFELGTSPFRLYYSTRNRVNLETRRFVQSKMMYWLNVWSYLLPLFLTAVVKDGHLKSRLIRLQFLLRCIHEGYAGELGEKPVSHYDIKTMGMPR